MKQERRRPRERCFMELPSPWTTVPRPGGPTEHSGEKRLFVLDTFSVKGDPEGHTCGVHMCGCVRGSLGLPHLGQMRRARIESPGKSSCPPLASDPSASHGAPWSLSTWHIWQAPPTSLPLLGFSSQESTSTHSDAQHSPGASLHPPLLQRHH